MALTDISSLHPPAVKVGGRRLSVSSRPKQHVPSEPAPAPPSSPADYPRPVHPTDDQAQAPLNPPPPPHHEEEAPPKKEKKHTNYENEKHLRDLAHRKIESTRPSKDIMGGHKGFGAAGRIAQPAAKFGI
ncbi:hypothetical protein D9615_000980 [Tricholomella constricta]|uniref:Uncharacterized protein n=1 Tax=Tricholomella constricta TaxID=117010 RepID=A0A8H5HKM0_9AGAR|nr:hypothetical protein D9615_000980 [Tricholomella constricta]